MGHDEHFLTRLDRIALPQVEFALSLYNDAPLLRFILLGAKIPDSAERVAISLADPVRGPFIIVTRNGNFVTCLGEGMSPGPHPIITRAKLDSLSDRAQTIRDRAELATKAVGRHGNVGKIVLRITQAGEFMSREEMAAVGLWNALLWDTLLKVFVTLQTGIVTTVNEYTTARHTEVIPAEKLKALWLAFWASQHLMTLLVMEFPEELPNLIAEKAPGKGGVSELLVALPMTGNTGFALRYGWIAARLYKHILPQLKKTFRESPYTWHAEDALLGLVAIASSHGRSRAEVYKGIEVPEVSREEGARVQGRYVAFYRSAMSRWVKPVIERSEDDHMAMVRTHGRALAMGVTRSFPTGHPHRYALADDVPDDIAMPMLFNARGPLHASSETNGRAFNVMPSLARAPMEQLYLPRDFLTGYVHRWDEQCIHDLLGPLRTELRKVPRRPRKVEEPPGRNDPCHCGSGKKFKRCCGG